MTDELIRKIQHLLRRRIRNELQVVYLLVELRKLMDREKYTDPILRTMSNWVVHAGLAEKREGSKLILTEFDNYLAELLERKRMAPHPQHLSLGTFRVSLKGCLKKFGLTATYLFELKEWKIFVRHYCSIVSECPMVFTASSVPLKCVQKVELRSVRKGIVKEWPIVEWKLTFTDGHTENWGFHMG